MEPLPNQSRATEVLVAERALFYADAIFVPINKANVRNEGVLRRFEKAAVALRLTEMRISPVEATFDMRHVRAIHQRLFGDVYSWAGEYKPTEIHRLTSAEKNSHIENVLRDARADFEGFGLSKDHLVNAVAATMTNFYLWRPFLRGNGVTGRVFASQLAESAGYDFNFSRIAPSRWNEATHAQFYRDGEPGSDAHLKVLVRDHLRPLRAREFSDVVKDGDRKGAVERFPELRAVFTSLDQATEQFRRSGHEPSKVERLSAELMRKMQRELNAGLNPERAWEEKLRTLAVASRGLER